MGDSGVEGNDTDDTSMSGYLGEDANLKAPYDRHFESTGMAGGRTEPTKTTATDRTTEVRGKGHPRDNADQRV